MAIINSSSILFIDNTDNRKLNVYITSNLPTTQIFNPNNQTYSPDWSETNLNLSIDVYLQSNKIENDNTVKILTINKDYDIIITSNERVIKINTSEIGKYKENVAMMKYSEIKVVEE